MNRQRYDKYMELIDKKVEALDKATIYSSTSEATERHINGLVSTIDMLMRLARLAANEPEPEDRKPSFMK